MKDVRDLTDLTIHDVETISDESTTEAVSEQDLILGSIVDHFRPRCEPETVVGHAPAQNECPQSGRVTCRICGLGFQGVEFGVWGLGFGTSVSFL